MFKEFLTELSATISQFFTVINRLILFEIGGLPLDCGVVNKGWGDFYPMDESSQFTRL
jgi:hypothetical protein